LIREVAAAGLAGNSVASASTTAQATRIRFAENTLGILCSPLRSSLEIAGSFATPMTAVPALTMRAPCHVAFSI
jgi:hypothetical protein